ncbi:MAG: hypothetical protein JXL97_16470 [Bacteroidales bacterium]|nr:hypothetical protein [Bacteroidales bacterium]
MNILVNGIGNIGTTLLNILHLYKNELSIDNIFALKNNPTNWNKADLEILSEKEIIICSSTENHTDFEEIKNKIDYIFDCTTNKYGNKNKLLYSELTNLKACSAQGSEKGFGIPFMSGINDKQIENQKFAHIVSCNTHSLASILTTFCGQNLDNLEKADFVIVRRSEDLGNHSRLVSANVVSRHLSSEVGTHHSIDVIDLFKTINKTVDISSSDITTPSQLMHSVRFNITLKNKLSQSDITEKINNSEFVSESAKFDSNVIFELGRRYSQFGRLYSHAIFVSNNILINNNEIKGWAFIPQEGNTILSTINAFLLQTANKSTEEIMKMLKVDLIRKKW